MAYKQAPVARPKKSAGLHTTQTIGRSEESENEASYFGESVTTAQLQRAIANPRNASPGAILNLQARYGNQAVQRMLVQRDFKDTMDKFNNRSKQLAGKVQTGFRRTFGTSNQQKAANPETLDAGSKEGQAFVKHATVNQSAFDREQAALDRNAQIKEDLIQKKHQVKLKMATEGKTEGGEELVKLLTKAIFSYDPTKLEYAQKAVNAIGKADEFIAGKGSTAMSAGKSLTSAASEKFGTEHIGQLKNASSNFGKGSDILSAVSGIGTAVLNFKAAVDVILDLVNNGDVAWATFRDRVFAQLSEAGKNILNLAKAGTNIAKDFGASGLGSVVPGLNIGVEAAILLNLGYKLVMEADRALSAQELLETAKKGGSKNQIVYEQAITHLRNRDIQLLSHNLVSVAASLTKIAGNITTLAGVDMGVGVAVTTIGTAVDGVNTTVRLIAESYKAGKVQENRKQFAESKDQADLEAGAAKVLLGHDPKHVTQFLITKARKYANYQQTAVKVSKSKYTGAKIALETVGNFNITPSMLLDESVTDLQLRTIMLTKLEQAEDPKTLGDKIVSGYNMAKDIVEKVINIIDKPTHVAVISQMKNILNYGDKKGRGTGWKIKQFFGGESVPQMRKTIMELFQAMNTAQKKELFSKFDDISDEAMLLDELILTSKGY